MADKVSQLELALRGLRRLVLSGEYPAGTRLRETELAARLGISRTPLREALSRLADEGLLERLETGGCRVASFTMEDIADAIEIRGVMEGTAARLAAERGISEAQARKAVEILRDLDAALSGADGVDFESYVTLNAAFHALVAEMSGSRVLRRELGRVTRLPLASPSAFLQGQELIPDFRASLACGQAQHRGIIDAITRRQGARAEALAREHARLAIENLRHVMTAGRRLAEKVPGLALITQ